MKEDLTYHLEDQVGHLLRRANQRHTSIFFDKMGQQLTPMQFAALIKIGSEGEISQNRLGSLTAMDPATVQGVVGRLSEKQMIHARSDPKDRRRSLWRLSDSGISIVTKAIPLANVITQHTLEPLSKQERKTFLKLLLKLS